MVNNTFDLCRIMYKEIDDRNDVIPVFNGSINEINHYCNNSGLTFKKTDNVFGGYWVGSSDEIYEVR
tara:strand:+ start:221 stop:421 length:201 start_codon:yes stop_codon:yes gene_type:complete